MKVSIRQLSVEELTQIGASCDIIWLAELGDKCVGRAAMFLKNGVPFVSDLEASQGLTEVAAQMIQRIRKDLRDAGHERVAFSIEQGSPALLPLILNGKARITHVIADMETA